MSRFKSLVFNIAAAFYVLAGAPSPLNARSIIKPDDIGARKVEVLRASPGIGISSGLVIAYGHPISTPYKFEYRGNFLFLNNVQVEPSIYRQNEYEKRRRKSSAIEEKKQYSELAELRESAQRHYAEQHGKVPTEKIQSEILGMFQKHPLIHSARWVRSDDLNYSSKMAPSVEIGVSFSRKTRSSPVKMPEKSTEERQINRISRLETDLAKGDLLFFMSDGGIWYARAHRIPEIKRGVARIMTQPTLSDMERQEQLQVLFYNAAGPVIDVLANFQPEEWE